MTTMKSLACVVAFSFVAASSVYAQTHESTHHGTPSSVTRDSDHLAAVLTDVHSKPGLDPKTWERVGKESNAYADRIYSHTTGESHKDASELRKHVRAMHEAGRKGDEAAVREHVEKVLPYVQRISERSSSGRARQH